jgi:DNA adenine methylase
MTQVPPIKSQGIKTKLVPWIQSLVPAEFNGRWIEPFMGTGVVAFNIAPKNALLCDTNPHLINFYSEIKNGKITKSIVRNFLETEGAKLLEKEDEHYYFIRNRFNESHSPLDFLFLNRAGFNGMIRFNKKGGFNIPFCKKPNRFAKAYVTKIVNQVDAVEKIIRHKGITFSCQSFEKTISEASDDCFIYCDPPYIGRHVDYFNGWNEENERQLFKSLDSSASKFILSTWHHNDYRENEFIESLWKKHNILTREHFYHVGGKESNRNPMIEAIVTNYDVTTYKKEYIAKQEQLILLEQRAKYGNVEAEKTLSKDLTRSATYINEEHWEQIITQEMKSLKIKEDDLEISAKGAKWKVNIAKRLRKETTAKNPWIAERLKMGHPNYVSSLIRKAKDDVG